jgi:hypothetical protein
VLSDLSSDIAFVLDRNEEEVREYVAGFCQKNNLTSFDEKTKLKEIKAADKINSKKKSKKKVSSAIINSALIKPKPSVYQTKKIDYSTMIPVRIDDKTIVYAKPGEDIELVKALALKRIQDSKRILFERHKTTKRVSNFKP